MEQRQFFFVSLHFERFLAETQTLSSAETGLYITVIVIMCRGGPVPFESIPRMEKTVRGFKRHWAAVRHLFVEDTTRREWRHDGVEESRARSMAMSSKQSGRAKSGWEKRRRTPVDDRDWSETDHR